MSCGWLNDDNKTFCVKCNATINGAETSAHSPNSGNRTGEGLRQPKTKEPEILNSTLREATTIREATQIQNKANSGKSLGVQSIREIPTGRHIHYPDDSMKSIKEIIDPISTPGNCPKCNYPLAAGTTHCPICNSSVQASIQPAKKPETGTNNNCPHCNYPLSATATICPRCNTEIDILGGSIRGLNDGNAEGITSNNEPEKKPFKGGTIPTFLFDENDENETDIISTCQLTIQTPNGTGESIEFSEKENILNRNTPILQNNMTISQEKHAVLSQENGDWYIEDFSSTKRTFVIVREKTKLEDGDIIILGNKFIEFKKK